MRPIKFRAWDDVEDKMYYTGEEMDVVFSFDDNGIVAEKILGEYETEELPYLKYMQFTGLYDRKGTPIYEGDIIQGRYGKNGLIKNYEVRWLRTHFTVVDIDKMTGKERYYPLGLLEGEVIGNIYEHPELLEGKK